ncbi:four-helix bundle copper-binding protein [Brevibacillus laterosporus]|uniref:four-helix bundle copper-binding protein n=1 Tax=Brevibacillus laterosporus TaxID=1465 RepID=UPI002E2428D5|nr:four-helix bundle copper-binding protein [Brevibacillus laterosporus]
MQITPQQVENCLQVCKACLKACNECYVACLQESELDTFRDCLLIVRQSAEICMLAISALSLDSMFSSQICKLTAEICEVCAKICSQHEQDYCQTCAQTCYQCAAACREMVVH